MPKFIRYMLYSAAKICQILGHSDAKSVLMEDCDWNFLVRHRENLNAVEADTRQPAVSSIPWSPVTYLSSTSRNTMEYYGKRQKASTNMIMTVSHIVRGLASDLRGGGVRCQKTSRQVWNSESAQRRGGVFADRPLVRPDKPQPRPSDVCVSSLMKKFWYLGETLLSAEQTCLLFALGPLGQSHNRPPSHQASGFISTPLGGSTRSWAQTQKYLISW